MATILEYKDAHKILNDVFAKRTGSEPVSNDDINFIGFGEKLADMDTTTSNMITSELTALVTEQVIIPAVYKDLGLNLITSYGQYSQTVGITQRSYPAIPELVSDSDAYNPTPGSSSDPFKANAIEMYTNYYFKGLQARIDYSIPQRWLSGAFLSEGAFNRFVDAVRGAVEFRIRATFDDVSLTAIRASIARNLEGGVGNRAYNLLEEFNALSGTTLTVANCMESPDFLRYSAKRINIVKDDMKATSVLFNEREYPIATDFDSAHVILLSRFQRAMETNLQSDTFHKELVALPNHATIPAWKGLTETAGGRVTFEAVSSVVDTFDFTNPDASGKLKVDQSGVIGHIFSNRRVEIEDVGVQTENQFDPIGLKTNYFSHISGRVIVDDYQPAVTFFVADATTP